MADCSELSQLLLDMTAEISKQPNVNNLDNVVTVMQRSIPRMNRPVLVDAIVEATAGKKKVVDELKQKFNEIKREARHDKTLNETITSLGKYLETGTFPGKVKEVAAASHAIKELRVVVKRLKAKLSKTEAAKKYRQKQREPKTINNLRQDIEALEKHITEGTLPAKVGNVKVKPTTAVRLLSNKRAELEKELAKTIPAREYRLKEQIKFLEKKIESGEIFPKPKEELKSSRNLEILEARKRLLQQNIRARISLVKPKGPWGYTKEAFNAFRALMTGGEFSLVLRQGGWTAMSRPGVVAKALPKMFRSFASESVSHKINEDILNRPNSHLYSKGKLHLAPIDGSVKLSAMEEVYMSHWIEKIPLIKNFQRAGLTFLNEIRADTFDILNASLPVTPTGAHNQKELEAIANYVNVSTGRGNLYGAERAAETLNTVFFAPKYVASRFQLLTGGLRLALPSKKYTAVTRKLIAKEYARALVGISTVMALGALAGADIEYDPRSPDFGKMKWGKTRLDPLFGLSQTLVVLSRIISGDTKRGSGEIVPLRPRKYIVAGEKRKLPYGQGGTADTMFRFMRSKLSPMTGTAIDFLHGKNLIGKEVDLKNIPLQLMVPLAYRDIYEALQEQGVPKATAFSMLVFFGMGLQTYDTKGKKKKFKVIGK